MVIAIYLGTYSFARYAAQDVVTIARVTADIGVASPGDSVLVRRTGGFRRGDVVIGDIWYRGGTPVAGPIIGLPGDLIEVRERIYVNGTPTNVLVQAVTASQSGFVRLGKDSYWVLPTFHANGGDGIAQMIARAGVIEREDMFGRAVAVIGPPAHRKLMTRINIFGE